jgi:hypothetical protein
MFIYIYIYEKFAYMFRPKWAIKICYEELLHCQMFEFKCDLI